MKIKYIFALFFLSLIGSSAFAQSVQCDDNGNCTGTYQLPSSSGNFWANVDSGGFSGANANSYVLSLGYANAMSASGKQKAYKECVDAQKAKTNTPLLQCQVKAANDATINTTLCVVTSVAAALGSTALIAKGATPEALASASYVLKSKWGAVAASVFLSAAASGCGTISDKMTVTANKQCELDQSLAIDNVCGSILK
jgi:hypothetical protein